MAGTIFYKGFMIYLIIGLFISIAGGPQGTGQTNKVTDDIVYPNGTFKEGFESTFPNVNEGEQGDATAIGRFIDTVKAVRDFIIFIGSIVFWLPMVLIDFNLPGVVLLAFGVPTIISVIFGLIYFVRSGN